MRRELVAERERHSQHGSLREVVEKGVSVVRRVVFRGPVIDLDHQAPGPLDQQRNREVTGDRVGLDRQPEEMQAVVEIRLPDRLVPLDLGRAEDVVDQEVEAAVVGSNPSDQRANLVGHQVIDRDGDPSSARLGHERSGFFDRLRPIHFRALGAGGSAGDVHRRSGGAQLDRNAATRPAGRSGHEGDLPLQ